MIAIGKPVTTEHIHSHLTEAGFKFKAANENVAINDALRSLEQSGEVKIQGKADAQRNLWAVVGNHAGPVAPVWGETADTMPTKSAEAQAFIRAQGPATRQELIAATGMLPGSFTHFVKKRTSLFRQREDEKWELVETKK